MPLVSPGSGSKLQLEAELIDSISGRLDNIDRELDKISAKRKAADSAAASASVSAAKTSGMAWTEFRSIYSTVLDVARVAGKVWDETAGKFVKYASEVRDVSRSLGSGTEEASRLIQVADDVGISYQSLTASMKLAQKDGVDPTIDGLARLADEYIKLKPGMERTQFLLDKFGKSGAEMGKLLEKGGDGIRAMSDAIADGQILTQEAVDQAREYEIAVDSLSDTWDAFTYQVAPPLIKATTDIVNIWRNEFDAIKKLQDSGLDFTVENWGRAYHEAAVENAALDEQTRKTAESNDQAAGTFDAVAGGMTAEEQAAKDLEKQLKEISDRNKEMLDFTISYADFQEKYADDHAKALDKVTEAQDKLNQARAEGATSEQIDGLVEGLQEAQQAVTDLEISWHEKTQRMIYDMILAKLSVDGLTDAEYDAALSVGVTMGILTQAEANQAKAIMDVANATVNAIHAQETLRSRAMSTADAYKSIGMSSNGAVTVNSTQGSRLAGNTASYQKRDSGGPGVAGTPYMIGKGAQPELFVPDSNGTFIPNADKAIGSSIVITINNPKGETAENSIRKSMKNLSFLGVVQ